MNKIWRNRAIMLIVVVLVALGAFLVQDPRVYDIWPRGGLTPFDRLEESGIADILHFGRVKSRQANNMIVHVAAILYPPSPDFSDAYVVIEDASYTIKRGGYEWEVSTKMRADLIEVEVRVAEGAVREYQTDPAGYAEKLGISVEDAYDLVTIRYGIAREKLKQLEDEPFVEEEPPDVEWSHWTVPKYLYYSSNGLFPPGRGEPAREAAEALWEWMNDEDAEARDKAMRDWLYVVVQEACRYKEPWSWIEIDLFNVAPLPTPALAATRKGKPDIVAEHEAIFTHTLYIYRRSPKDSDWTIDKLLDEGELTREKVKWMMETGQLQMYPAMSPYGGAIPYAYEQYGFNHPWQGREISQ